MQVSRTTVLRFPPEVAGEPVVFHLVKDYSLQFNILRASINPEDEGLMVLEITGGQQEYAQGIKYLRQAGVAVQLLSKDVSREEDRCTHCGACVALCPARAFVVQPGTRYIDFVKEKCMACGICIMACPVRALELRI